MSIQPDPMLSSNFTDQIKTQDLADLSRQWLKISPGKILSAGPVAPGLPQNDIAEKVFRTAVIAVTMATIVWYNFHWRFIVLRADLYHIVSTLIY